MKKLKLVELQVTYGNDKICGTPVLRADVFMFGRVGEELVSSIKLKKGAPCA